MPEKIDWAKSVKITVTKADGAKCARCWHFENSTGASVNYPNVCHNCADLLVQYRFPPYRVEDKKLVVTEADIIVPSWLQKALKLPATISYDPKWLSEVSPDEL